MDGRSPMHPHPVDEMERWMLEDRYGKRIPLKKNAMLFLGREECDILLKSKSVDGQHAVLVFDEYVERFKVKDLSSMNGTFVNESRIPEDTYMYVEHADTLRFGYDSMVYRVLAASRAGDPPVSNGALSPITRTQRPHTAPAQGESQLPNWATKEIDQMESPVSCLEDQLLLPGVLPPIMAECSACMAENRMECHDDDLDFSPTPRPAPAHSCGFFPSMAAPRAPRDNPLPPCPSAKPKTPPPTPGSQQRRHEAPPSSLPLSGNSSAARVVSDLEILSLNSSPRPEEPVTLRQLESASSQRGSSPNNRRKSIKELYGQPEWWGQDDGDFYSYPHTSCLVGTDASKASKNASPHSHRGPTESPRTHSGGPITAVTPTRPAEAFTVVFEPEEPEEPEPEEPPVPAAPPLSQFVPSKIRKSFMQREQKRKPPEKSKPDAPASTPRISGPVRSTLGRPGPSSGSTRGRPNPTRPSSATTRADANAIAKRPPRAPKSARVGTKETVSSFAQQREKCNDFSPVPTKSNDSPRARITPMSSRATDKAKSSSRAEQSHSLSDSKSYLFAKMYPASNAPASIAQSVAPLRPQNRMSPKLCPVTNTSPLPLSPNNASSPRSDNGSGTGTYTIEKESEEYDAARKVDLSLEGIEREAEQRVTELSMDDVSQKEDVLLDDVSQKEDVLLDDVSRKDEEREYEPQRTDLSMDDIDHKDDPLLNDISPKDPCIDDANQRTEPSPDDIDESKGILQDDTERRTDVRPRIKAESLLLENGERGRADGDDGPPITERKEEEEEEEEDEELREPLSVAEATCGYDSDDVEQEPFSVHYGATNSTT